jgi:Glutathione S-transferase, N-terminal domain
VKLYVCYGTFGGPGHACGRAHDALRKAGWQPEVVKSYGSAFLPDILNRTRGRREARELTGQSSVPVLVTDDGDVIHDSKRIADWAERNPAGASDRPPADKRR